MVDWQAISGNTAHRPWPAPARGYAITMTWLDLLFAHWPVPAESIASRLPAGLEVDTHEGRAWLGIVPFRMANVGPRGLGWLPGVSAFPELNVRTYVRRNGERPGVWFFSLDAASRSAVWAARALYHLPYFHARVRCERDREGWVEYASERKDPRLGPGRLRGRYRPTGPESPASAGTLEHWLTERYCLYTATRAGTLLRGEIAHARWPLRPAEAELSELTVSDAHGLPVAGPPPLLHFVDRLDVVAWTLEPA